MSSDLVTPGIFRISTILNSVGKSVWPTDEFFVFYPNPPCRKRVSN